MAPNAAEKVSKGIAISLGKDFGLCCMQLQPDGAASLHTAHTHTPLPGCSRYRQCHARCPWNHNFRGHEQSSPGAQQR